METALFFLRQGKSSRFEKPSQSAFGVGETSGHPDVVLGASSGTAAMNAQGFI